MTSSSRRLGPGVLTGTYNGNQFTQSFLDSGSSHYFFIDTSLPPCTENSLIAFYCPTSPILLSPVLTATNGTTVSAGFTLCSPPDVAGSSNVAPGLGVNPTLVTPPLPFANSFDFGLPFSLAGQCTRPSKVAPPAACKGRITPSDPPGSRPTTVTARQRPPLAPDGARSGRRRAAARTRMAR